MKEINIYTEADKRFYLAYSNNLHKAFKGEWVLLYQGKFLFSENDEQDMFQRAIDLGLKWGTYSYFLA